MCHGSGTAQARASRPAVRPRGSAAGARRPKPRAPSGRRPQRRPGETSDHLVSDAPFAARPKATPSPARSGTGQSGFAARATGVPRGTSASLCWRLGAVASALGAGPWEHKAHKPSDLVVSHRHCINHPELETPSVACASRRGMLDEEARLEHRATCL